MAAPVTIGELFEGKYRIESILGEGGMGVVVAATHEQLNRKVAIKFLLPELSSHEEVRRRFVREARAAASLESEHVAHVLDVVENDQGTSYMVIEFLDGSDLSDLIENEGPLDPQVAVDYLLQACEALAEAHRQGIVHRDLKPGNLFLSKRADDSLTIKVLDFGISKVSSNRKSMALTQDADVLGSPLYMPPEQIRSSKNVDPRSDIWALGVILFEFLTGDVPFPGETIQEVMSKVLFEPPPNLLEIRPDVPEKLWNVIERCLQKDPASRYQNLAELAVDLEPFGTPGQASLSVQRILRVQQSTAYTATKPVDTALRRSVPDTEDVARTEVQATVDKTVATSSNSQQKVAGADTSVAVSSSVSEKREALLPEKSSNRGVIIAVGGAIALAIAFAGYMFSQSSSTSQSSTASTGQADSATQPEPSTTTTTTTTPTTNDRVGDAGCGDACASPEAAPSPSAPASTTTAPSKQAWPHARGHNGTPAKVQPKPPPTHKPPPPKPTQTAAAKPAPTHQPPSPKPTVTNKPNNNPLNVDIK